MKEVLLTNIGNRNIRYNREFIEKSYDKGNEKNESFYEFTKLLFENIEEEKDNIKIEIIDSILEKNNISEIYIFTTNQNLPFKQDTYYEAKIIEYLLKDKYKINIIEYKADPRIREEVFKFFEDFFNKNNFSKNKVFVNGSGGVPAMKESLNFYSILNLKNSEILDVDEKTGKIFSSNVQKEYLKNLDKKTFNKMIENFNYSGAYIFLKNSFINNISLENFCLYLQNRFNFNFEKANNLLKNFKSNYIEKIEIIDLEKEENIKKRQNFIKNMIIELFDNLEITFEKGDYIGFLGKTFSLQENVIKYLFEKEFKLNTNFDFERLEEIGIEIKENKFGKKYVEIFSLLEKLKEKDNTELKEFLEFNKKLIELKKLRNKSIIAHSFGGIKREDIEPTYKEIIKFKKDFFGITENFYKQIYKKIKI